MEFVSSGYWVNGEWLEIKECTIIVSGEYNGHQAHILMWQNERVLCRVVGHGMKWLDSSVFS